MWSSIGLLIVIAIITIMIIVIVVVVVVVVIIKYDSHCKPLLKHVRRQLILEAFPLRSSDQVRRTAISPESIGSFAHATTSWKLQQF